MVVLRGAPDENKVPRLKRMLHEVETNIGKSVFHDYSDGEKQTSAMFGKSGLFLAPKHSPIMYPDSFFMRPGRTAPSSTASADLAAQHMPLSNSIEMTVAKENMS